MRYFVSLISMLVLGASVADAAPMRDPRVTNVYSAGKGVTAAAQSVSLGGGQGVNLVTEMPLMMEQQYNEAMNMQLPVRVANKDKEYLVRVGDTAAGVDLEDLNICANLRPGAVFAWDTPTFPGAAGVVDMTADTCVMEVDLVYFDNTQQKRVASMRVPFGTSFDCTIESFPEDGYLPAIETTILPAEHEPTIEDVERVMDEERKDNTAIKTVAGMVVGGVMGNMFGDGGKDSGLFGTGGNKVYTTLGGAAIGAGGMYASQQVGHVAGSVVESGLAGGAGGMLIGNITGGALGGTAVLDIQDCKLDPQDTDTTDCLLGFVYTGGQTAQNVFCKPTDLQNCFTQNDDKVAQCRNFVATYSDGKCKPQAGMNVLDTTSSDCQGIGFVERNNLMGGGKEYVAGTCTLGGTQKRAVARWTGSKSATLGDFNKMNPAFNGPVIEAGLSWNGTGTEIALTNDVKFEPATKGASDGGVIDFNNAARNKATAIGGAAGAGVGGFAGYKRAEGELADRYLAAVTEYAASLEKWWCISGPTNRLARYGEAFSVPTP